MKKVITLSAMIALTLSFGYAIAQSSKTGASAPEDIVKKCKDIPIEQRTKISVARFSVSATGDNGSNFDNFSTTLENALVNIDCFRVLGMAKDNGDIAGTENEDASLDEKPQYIIAGEITSYSIDDRNHGVFVAKKTTQASISFIVKIKQGKDIIWTQKFNATGTSDSKRKGLFQTVTQRVGNSSKLDKEENTPINKAYNDAINAGIDSAVSYIADMRDQMVARGNRIQNKGEGQSAVTIVMSKATFTRVSEVEKQLKASPVVLKETTNFKDGVARFVVEYKGTYDDIMNILTGNLAKTLEVTGSEPNINKISAEAK